MLEPLPDSFIAARDGMHALAEHVLAPARYRSDGHIGLVPTPGGFGTPTFGEGERVRVDGVELVHERPGTSTRVRITTLGAGALRWRAWLRPSPAWTSRLPNNGR